jgi:hypothetical protein
MSTSMKHVVCWTCIPHVHFREELSATQSGIIEIPSIFLILISSVLSYKKYSAIGFFAGMPLVVVCGAASKTRYLRPGTMRFHIAESSPSASFRPWSPFAR